MSQDGALILAIVFGTLRKGRAGRSGYWPTVRWASCAGSSRSS